MSDSVLPTSPVPTARAPAKIRVLCVDDSEDITEMLGRCIAREPDMENAGSMQSADSLLLEVKRLHPDVVLLDMTMPGKDPLAVLRELTATHPARRGQNVDASGAGAGECAATAHVIVFSGRSDQDAVNSAIDAGASGFLSKDAEIRVTLEAIREVARGTVPFGVWL